MAVMTQEQITLTNVTDVKSTCRYYLLQSSALSAPAKPTTNPPTGWTKTEPSYTAGSTNSLYFTDLTVFSNDTFSYSDVSLSSSYEAAKTAYNKAVEAAKTATNYIDYSETEGLQVGNKQSGEWTGARTQQTSNAFNILGEEGELLASYGASSIKLGGNSTSSIIDFCGNSARMRCFDASNNVEFGSSRRMEIYATGETILNASHTFTSSEMFPDFEQGNKESGVYATADKEKKENFDTSDCEVQLAASYKYKENALADYVETKSAVVVTPESINLQSDAVTVNGKKLGATLLWTNPRPTSTFTKQNITMLESMLNFDFIMIEYLYDVTTYNRNKLAFARSGCETQLPCVGAVNQGERVIRYVNETTFEVGNANYSGSQQNRYAVPLNIYGFNMIF